MVCFGLTVLSLVMFSFDSSTTAENSTCQKPIVVDQHWSQSQLSCQPQSSVTTRKVLAGPLAACESEVRQVQAPVSRATRQTNIFQITYISPLLDIVPHLILPIPALSFSHLLHTPQSWNSSLVLPGMSPQCRTSDRMHLKIRTSRCLIR